MTDRELAELLLEKNKELKSRLKNTSIGLWVAMLGYIIIIIYAITLIGIN
jgi:hypothetical protein